MIGAPGRDIERPALDRWRVFIQSMHGHEFVDEGTLLLYEVNLICYAKHASYILAGHMLPKLLIYKLLFQDLGYDTYDLEPIDSGRLEILNVNKTCSLRDFVEKIHQLVPYNPRRFFFEFVSAEEDISDDKQIIIMDKVLT